jgi:transposase
LHKLQWNNRGSHYHKGMAGKRPAQAEPGQWHARRKQAEQMFAAGERQAEIARTLGISRQCVHNWFWRWQESRGRRGESRTPRSGRRCRLTPAQLAEIDGALRRGPRAFGFARERWTLWRIASIIERISGIAYHPSSVWRLMRTIGWTLKAPPKGERRKNRSRIRQWSAPPPGINAPLARGDA